MNRKIISVLVILILALSIVLQMASATPAAKEAYKKVYPTAPDPAPGENLKPPNCGGLCHDPKQPDLSKYGENLNKKAMEIYGKTFKPLTEAQKIDVLKKVGSGTNPPIPPVPELKTGILVTAGMIGLLGLVRISRIKGKQ
jgi:hypothetical protein